jgi:hypothetical protein
MRLLFVNWAYDNHGSAVDLYQYTQIARTLGHEVTLYGVPNLASAFNYSLDVASVDAIVFIFEFTTRLEHGEAMGFCRMLGNIPRSRRVVIDCDGKYNDAISVGGDVNHPDAESSRRWVEICDSLSDTVLQPTHRPLRSNVRPFFFHAYDPAWEMPLDCDDKEFGMVYVGNNWFRWRALQRVLSAIAPMREKVGRIGLVGSGWDAKPAGVDTRVPEDAYYTDPELLRSQGAELFPPVRFDQVVSWMGRGVFSPVIYRPLFDHLRLVTCRTFETPAANTIPLFCQEGNFVREVYGDAASELVLPSVNPLEKVLDLLARRRHYLEVANEIRRQLARRYSYADRLRELIAILGG